MSCPRCRGRLLGAEEPTCINCGYVWVHPAEIAAAYEHARRYIHSAGRQGPALPDGRSKLARDPLAYRRESERRYRERKRCPTGA
ncbi:MAG TPA: hypothetical protein VFB20_10725 [Burkholderiales bacterium]|nr:hypothetical protein [Burkholderiales bacterium]